MSHTLLRRAAAPAFVLALGVVAALAQDVPEPKRTKLGLYLTASQAADMLAEPGAVLVDLRSRGEVAFLGLPERADVHIPYMVMPMMAEYSAASGGYGLEINPDFPGDFRDWAEANGVGPDTRIVLMCRSGNRSARAADLLSEMGYRNVYSMIDGYEGDKAREGPGKGRRIVNGWCNAGLGWSYTIRPDQAYPADR